MINRIILITTKGCTACDITRNILKSNIDEDVFEEYDVNDLPSIIHDSVVLHDFPTTLFVNFTPDDFEIKHYLIGSFSKAKLFSIIDNLK